jgi:hypothetical protein
MRFKVAWKLNGRWERTLFTERREAEKYAERIARWSGVTFVQVCAA